MMLVAIGAVGLLLFVAGVFVGMMLVGTDLDDPLIRLGHAALA